MSTLLKIAIVGVAPLEVLGLEKIIRDNSKHCVTVFKSPDDIIDSGKGADIYIASLEAFIGNLSYFSLRKTRTVILNNRDSSDEGGPIFINVSDSLQNISAKLLEVLSRFCGDAVNGNEALSVREIDVIKLIAEGKSYKEIADMLCISLNTVMSHKKNISSKLGIHSYSGLSLYAVMNGYGKPEGSLT